MYLSELRIPASRLTGVGLKAVRDFASLGVLTVADLLMHLPRDYEDRSRKTPFAAVRGGGAVNTTALITGHDYFGFGAKRTLKILLRDETGEAELVCFGRNFLAENFPQGMRVDIAGNFTLRGGRLQSTSFEMESAGARPELFTSVLSIYPLAGKLSQKLLRKTLRQACEKFAFHLEDEIPPELLAAGGNLSLPQALKAVHFPQNLEEAEKGRASLALREFFFLQMPVARRAIERKAAVRTARTYPRGLQEKLIKSLPFRLTPGQEAAIEEMRRDSEAAYPMARLLQGDVGCGKTLAAFLAAVLFTAGGRQTALMAPTELLARQHADNAARYLEPLGVRLAFFSGSLSAKERKPVLAALGAGEIDIIIGTHALFSDDVEFRDLGLVIIDEQHRFGVAQRARLFAKGLSPDLLVMSATPIPQTLALSAFGDLDVSTITTMPPGRKPVETHLAQEGKEKKVYDWVRRELEAGRQAYFVYPLIEESEALALKDAASMYTRLAEEIFPRFSVGLIHSKLAEDEKRSIMEKFSRGEIAVLAATSVVEVGVDVANATCMVIEHAERFGLAALHQLRGRVGRGAFQSYAFLVFSPELTDVGKKRLRVMKETTDGFRIAEEDLLLRGPGDLTGIRQAGLLDFRAARLPGDTALLLRARDEVRAILEKDPGLLLPQHAALRGNPGAGAGAAEAAPAPGTSAGRAGAGEAR
ncbi:MAG: ATP-dependent DNA helicase RecG [Spirochaetales bacterium]|jgi:ATP-dependent DNA helicase RecG|nr:ATP-dependent DNA helicase RecG [Spirochaetales bacterium]